MVLTMRSTASWPRAATPGVMTATPPARFCRNSSLSARIRTVLGSMSILRWVLDENRRHGSSGTPEVGMLKNGYACDGLGVKWPQERRRPEGLPYSAAGLIRAMAERCRIMLGQSG